MLNALEYPLCLPVAGDRIDIPFTPLQCWRVLWDKTLMRGFVGLNYKLLIEAGNVLNTNGKIPLHCAVNTHTFSALRGKLLVVETNELSALQDEVNIVQTVERGLTRVQSYSVLLSVLV